MGNMKTTKPFWSREIAAATKACSNARKIAHESDQQALDNKLAKKFLKQVTLKAQEENWQAYASSLDPRTNPSMVWNTIAAMDGRKPKTVSGSVIKDGSKTATTNREKANLFTTSYKRDSRLEGDKWADKPQDYAARRALGHCNSCSGESTGMCCPFTEDELDHALWKLKPGKSLNNVLGAVDWVALKMLCEDIGDNDGENFKKLLMLTVLQMALKHSPHKESHFPKMKGCKLATYEMKDVLMKGLEEKEMLAIQTI